MKRKTEIWLIDYKEGALYRVISDTKEQAVLIKGNPAMSRFMCVHQDEFEDFVEDTVNGGL